MGTIIINLLTLFFFTTIGSATAAVTFWHWSHLVVSNGLEYKVYYRPKMNGKGAYIEGYRCNDIGSEREQS